MPLKSGGAVDNEYARGRANCGLLSMGKKAAAFLYVGLETGDSAYTKGGVVKVDLIEWSKVSTLLFSADEPYVEGVCIDEDYLYACTRTNPAKIVKVNLKTFTKEATLTLDAGEGYAYDILVIGDYLYVTLATSPAKIVKITISTFTKYATLTLNIGENNARALATSGDYLYVGLGSLWATGKIAKVKLADFTREDVLTLNTTEQMPYSVAVSGDYLYAGLRMVTGQPARVIKISIPSLTNIGPLTIGDINDLVWYLAVYEGYLYASKDAHVAKIDLSTFTWIADLDVPSGWSTPYRMLVDSGILYVSAKMDPARIFKVNLSTFTIVDTLIFDVYDYEAHGLAAG